MADIRLPEATGLERGAVSGEPALPSPTGPSAG